MPSRIAHSGKRVQLSVWVPESSMRSLRVLSVQRNSTIQELVTAAIDEYLARNYKEDEMGSQEYAVAFPGGNGVCRWTGDWKRVVRVKTLPEGPIYGDLFAQVLREFAGRTVPLDSNGKRSDGLGTWVATNAKNYNHGIDLPPKAACSIAAILIHEANVRSWIEGKSVFLGFPASAEQ